MPALSTQQQRFVLERLRATRNTGLTTHTLMELLTRGVGLSSDGNKTYITEKDLENFLTDAIRKNLVNECSVVEGRNWIPSAFLSTFLYSTT